MQNESGWRKIWTFNRSAMSGNIEKDKQRIADLLESLDLYLEWLYIFDRLCLKLKDKDGKEVWSLRAIDIDYLRTELLHFLEDEKRKEDTPATYT